MSPAPAIGQRADQGYSHLLCAGRDMGKFPMHDGGGVSTPSNKQRHGYGLAEVEAGGPKSVGDVTLERIYVVETMLGDWEFLYEQAGKGECVVTRVYQDGEGNVVDGGRPRGGKLLVVNEPPLDIGSQDGAMMHLEIGMHGIAR